MKETHSTEDAKVGNNSLYNDEMFWWGEQCKTMLVAVLENISSNNDDINNIILIIAYER